MNLFLPALLVLGGGSLVSIPKDWKDIESDRRAGIPTYYVLLTGRGKAEASIHRWIVAVMTACLIVPPVFMATTSVAWVVCLPGILALVPGCVLLLLKDRRRAVRGMMWALAAYLAALAFAIRYFRTIGG